MDKGDICAFYYDKQRRIGEIVRTVADVEGDTQWMILDQCRDKKGHPQFYIKYPDSCHDIDSIQPNGEPFLTEDEAVVASERCEAMLDDPDVHRFIRQDWARRQPEKLLVRGRVITLDVDDRETNRERIARLARQYRHAQNDLANCDDADRTDMETRVKELRHALNEERSQTVEYEIPWRVTLRDAPTIEESGIEHAERKLAAGKGKAYTTPGADLSPEMMSRLVWSETRQKRFEDGLDTLAREGRVRKGRRLQPEAYRQHILHEVPVTEVARDLNVTPSAVTQAIAKATTFMDRWMGWSPDNPDSLDEKDAVLAVARQYAH